MSLRKPAPMFASDAAGSKISRAIASMANPTARSEVPAILMMICPDSVQIDEMSTCHGVVDAMPLGAVKSPSANQHVLLGGLAQIEDGWR